MRRIKLLAGEADVKSPSDQPSSAILPKLAERLVATSMTHIVECDELLLPTERVGFVQGRFWSYLAKISLNILAQT